MSGHQSRRVYRRVTLYSGLFGRYTSDTYGRSAGTLEQFDYELVRGHRHGRCQEGRTGSRHGRQHPQANWRTRCQQPTQASGTGFIISNDGYIVTNNHVVENERTLTVIFSDGKKADASLTGTDSSSDLAVLKVNGQMPSVVNWGSSTSLQPGQLVVAIGSALGDFRNSVTAGVVSGVNRNIGPGYEQMIQTDAAINHGNSGGPLLNSSGQVVGVNTAVLTSSGNGDIAQGLGFAIPSDLAKSVVDQLTKNGKVTRPFLGISYQTVTPGLGSFNDLGVDSGALVQDVSAGSPAAKAGILKGDVITAVDGVKIDDSHPLPLIMSSKAPGDTVTLTIFRNGKETSVKATLVERPS